MKKFIKIALCFCLCVITIFSFTACGEKKLEMPASSATITSNGGMVVKKGNFLYFANGYYSVDNITKKSQLNDKYSTAGLYFNKTNSNGSINYDENGSMKSAERLSSRLAGFEATDIHIFGDYLYFTTINTEETKSGGLQVDHLEIYRIKLDGTKLKRVYRSKVDFEDSEGNRVVEFEYFAKGSNVYILIRENGTLKRVSCSKKSIGDAEKISSDVKSYACLDNQNIYNQIFFVTMDDGDYVVNRYNIESDSIITKSKIDKEEISSLELFDVKFDNLYFNATLNDGSGSSYLYRISLEDFEEYSFVSSAVKQTSTSYTAIYLLENFLDGIMVISSSSVQILDAENPTENYTTTLMPADATIMLVKGGYVYYYSESEIKRFNCTTNEIESIYTETNTICNYQFDIDGNYLYYFATVGSNDYLFRVAIADASPEKKSELIGFYEESDIPSAEEVEE